MSDLTDRNRVPAGVTTGGQFATEPRSETDVELGDTAPVPLRDVVAWDTDQTLWVDEYEHGDPTLAGVQVTSTDEGFHVEGFSQPLGFVEGMSRHADKLGLDPEDTEALGEYLTTREHIVTEWFEREYGVDALDTGDIDCATASFAADLPYDATTADILDALHEAGKVTELHNESDPGTYGTRDLWRVLAEHLAADDERAKHATTTITWRRRFPMADDDETWKAEVPISLLRDVDSGRLAMAELDQYICNHGQVTDRGTADRGGHEYDEVRHDFVDRAELRPIYHLVPEQD